MSSAFGYGVDLINQPQGGGGSSDVLVLISDNLLLADQASVSITSIPATSKHLKLVVNGRTTAALTEDIVRIRFNNDSGANYDTQFMFASGGGVNHSGEAAATKGGMSWLTAANAARAASAGLCVTDILDYASTTFEKTMITTGGDPSSLSSCTSSFWRSTAAINRIDVFPDSAANFKAGTRVTLYGY